MGDPEAVFLWGDEYWQHIPQFVLEYLDEVANIYDLDTKTNSEAKQNWVAHDYRDAIAEKLRLEDGIKVEDPRREIGTCHWAADGFACLKQGHSTSSTQPGWEKAMKYLQFSETSTRFFSLPGLGMGLEERDICVFVTRRTCLKTQRMV